MALLKEQSKLKHTFLCFDLVNPDKGVTVDRLSLVEISEIEALLSKSPEPGRTEARLAKALVDKREHLFTTLEHFLSDQPVSNRKKGNFLFRLIHAKLSEQLDPEDLSVKLSRGRKGQSSMVTKRASILNFILVLLDPKGDLTNDTSELLEYMKQKGITFPRAYVNNIMVKKYL